MKNSLRKLKDANGRAIWNTDNLIGSTGVSSKVNTINAIPIEFTNNIASTGLTGTDESAIFGGDFSQMLLGSKELRIDVATEASGLWENDKIGLRMVYHFGYALLHSNVFVVIKDVKY